MSESTYPVSVESVELAYDARFVLVTLLIHLDSETGPEPFALTMTRTEAASLARRLLEIA